MWVLQYDKTQERWTKSLFFSVFLLFQVLRNNASAVKNTFFAWSYHVFLLWEVVSALCTFLVLRCVVNNFCEKRQFAHVYTFLLEFFSPHSYIITSLCGTFRTADNGSSCCLICIHWLYYISLSFSSRKKRSGELFLPGALWSSFGFLFWFYIVDLIRISPGELFISTGLGVLWNDIVQHEHTDEQKYTYDYN